MYFKLVSFPMQPKAPLGVILYMEGDYMDIGRLVCVHVGYDITP